MTNPDAIRMEFTGSPPISAIRDSAEAFQRLVDTLASTPIPLEVIARCLCDGCGATSEPTDLADPETAEAALRAAGWARDTEAGIDLCPECAKAATS